MFDVSIGCSNTDYIKKKKNQTHTHHSDKAYADTPLHPIMPLSLSSSWSPSGKKKKKKHVTGFFMKSLDCTWLVVGALAGVSCPDWPLHDEVSDATQSKEREKRKRVR